MSDKIEKNGCKCKQKGAKHAIMHVKNDKIQLFKKLKNVDLSQK